MGGEEEVKNFTQSEDATGSFGTARLQTRTIMNRYSR